MSRKKKGRDDSMADKKTGSGDNGPPSHEEDPLLTLSEVGRQLGKSPQTVGRWCQEKLLEFVRLPSGLIAIRQSVVDKFLGGTALGGGE